MSRKHKRIILEISRAAIIAVGMLLSVLSPFVDLSPIMNDWRINLATGLFLTFVGIIWYLIDLNRKFLWEEPVLELSTVTELEMAQGNHFPASAKLVVYNDEEQEVTECYATLVSAKNLYGGQMIPVDMVNEERLKWREDGFSNELCEMKIPPKDKRNIMVASNMNGFQFAVCKSRIMRHDLLGVHLIKIRIDAKFGGRNVKPQFFNGYLYINNQFHEMRATETVSGHDAKGEFFEKKREISEPSVITTMIFEEGDWMKDKRIPKLGKVGQAK